MAIELTPVTESAPGLLKRAEGYLSPDFWNALFSGVLGSLVASAFFLLPVLPALSAGAIYLVLLLYWINRRRRKALESILQRRANFDLARTTLQQIAKLLKSKLRVCHAQGVLLEAVPHREDAARLADIAAAMKTDVYDEGLGRLKLIHEILTIICDQFSRDTFGKKLLVSRNEDADEDWPQDFFKATYYERRTNRQGQECLERVDYVYPPGLTPNHKSQSRPLNPEEAGVAYFVIQRGEMRVLEDIRNKEERKRQGWVDYYSGQPERYRSMVVAPVMQDLGVDGQRGIGVVSIDTGTPRYFRDDVAYRAFLSDLISPYLALLALLWESEELHKAWCAAVS